MQPPANLLFEQPPRIIEQVDGPVDRGEIMRYLGYPAEASPNPQIVSILDRWIDEANQLAAPRAIYVVLPVVEKDQRRLRLKTADGAVEFRGAIGEFLSPSRSVAAFIATAGPDIVRLASELSDARDDLAAMIVSAVGAERAEAAEAAVVDELRAFVELSGYGPTLPYSPGYCGMSLSEQGTLFSLFDQQNIGVTLTAECLMRPLKSVSGLIGLGPVTEIKQFGTPCDRCDLQGCNMRR